MRGSFVRFRAFASGLVVGVGLLATAAFASTTALAAQNAASEATADDGYFDALAYRHIGPAGNRVIAVIGEPGNPNVYYAGAASGGVWRSTDGGHAWEPVFDDQDVSSIGALALAPSDPNVLWAGTGETFIRANISLGNGIYRSTDGGDTWSHRGLDLTGRIGRIVIHPRNPDVVYACALGHTYGPQEERGVYRTRDGGDTWERILFVDPDTGCSDIVMDPTNPRILFAGMWQIEVATWGRTSGGPGSSLWTSRDGGDTWERLEGAGLPTGLWGKIGLGMTPADPERVYALIETSSNRDFAPSDPQQGVLWRSDDGGRSWRMVNGSNDLAARWLYYTRLTVSPTDADEVYFNAPGHFTSVDGGLTHRRTQPSPGFDHHDMWIDPTDPDRMISGHDGGVSISTTHGRSWHRPQLPIAQMYHGHVDDRIPYNVYGNRQDGPSIRAPSNTLTGGEIPIGEWRAVGGCEVGFAVPDTVDHRTVWTGCYDGLLSRHDLETGLTRDVTVWPVAIEATAAEELKYRWQWTFPIEISPHDHETVYVGSQHVHRTTNGGQSWEEISSDLTSDDPELQRRWGGLTLDDAGPTIAPVVFAIAESPLTAGEIWAGTNDGYVQLTRDGGGSWTNVTANLPGLPARSTVSSINPSRHQAGKAYVAVDAHQIGDFDPYLYVTTDWGESWRRIDADIPRSVLSFTHVLREDPVRPGLLYAGTENGVWVSFDDGASWRSLQSNLPPAPVHWIAVQERFHDLVISTYGRGYWILDDITPLQQGAGSAGGPSTPAAGAAGASPALQPATGATATLFQPRDAWRFRFKESAQSQPGDPTAGTNPPYGASIHYALVSEVESVSLAIVDAAGDTVRTLSGPSDVGLHRVWWNLRGETSDAPRLKTPPDESPQRSLDGGTRGLPDGGRVSLLLPPGRYTVALTAGDETLTRPLTVLKDPVSLGSEADIAAQLPPARNLFEMTNRAVAVINEIEDIRVQLDDLLDRLSREDLDDREALLDQIRAAEETLKEIEYEFFDLRLTGDGQDTLRWARLLYAQIVSLARGVQSSDAPPTDQQLEVHEMLRGQLDDVERRFREDGLGAIDELNQELRDRGVPVVTTGRPRAAS